jgi:Cu-processing system ATP-binding protein
MNGAPSHAHVMLVQDDAQKMALLRQAADDPSVRNIEIEAPTLDQLYAHFLQAQESAA